MIQGDNIWWILALIQGLTEFLPISSSAHLVLPSQLLGWPDQGLAFDVAVHLGTLLAVLIYYRQDLMLLAKGTVQSIRSGTVNDDSRWFGFLVVATVPAVVVGASSGDFIENQLRSVAVIAGTTLIFGLLLGVADLRVRQVERWMLGFWSMALALGLAQSLALIPGVSRSGITLTAALLLGMSYQSAAKTSFLMSIPVIFGAGVLKTIDLVAQESAVDWSLLLTSAALAGITAYSCITVFLRILDRVGLRPFMWYRLILGMLLLLTLV